MARRKVGKRIGFVDYVLDNFHSNTFLRLLRGDAKARGFTVAGCNAVKERTGRAWAKQNKVPYFADMNELNERVDGYMVFAPSNPELHLDLCRKTLPFGKPTYVDKTFAPDLKTARRLFALADKHHAPMQTSSALRYTNVQEHVAQVGGRSKVRHMVGYYGGRSFGEYGIHPTELVISSMGPNATRLMRRGTGRWSQLLVDFSGGRTAVINSYLRCAGPFGAAVTTAKGTTFMEIEGSRMFGNATHAILDLFESGKPNIDRAESLMIRRILDVAEDPRALRGFVNL